MGTNVSKMAIKMAERNEMEKLFDLLEKNTSIPSECEPSPGGETLLHWASFHGNVKVVRKLLEMDHLVHLATNEHGYTALHVASERGHVDVISILIQNGAVASTLDKNKCSPLHYALLNGHYSAALLLLNENAKIDAKDKRGFNGLHYACYSGNVASVRMALERLRDTTTSTSNSEESYLEWRAEGGFTPLLCACHREYNCVDGDGEHLNRAELVSHAAVVDVLMEAGSDIRAVDDDGNTCLHIAAMERQCASAEAVLRAARIVLRDNLCTFIDTRNSDGDTAFHIACVKGQVRLAVTLINAKANVFTVGTSFNEAREEPIKLCPSVHMFRLTYAAILRNSIYTWLGTHLKGLDPVHTASVAVAFKRAGVCTAQEFSCLQALHFSDEYLKGVIGVPLRGLRRRLQRVFHDVSSGIISILEDNNVDPKDVLPSETDSEPVGAVDTMDDACVDEMTKDGDE